MFVYTLAPFGDTLGSLWDQTETECSSKALKAYISMLALWSVEIKATNRLEVKD